MEDLIQRPVHWSAFFQKLKTVCEHVMNLKSASQAHDASVSKFLVNFRHVRTSCQNRETVILRARTCAWEKLPS